MTGRTSCIPDLVDRYAVPARTASAELVVKKSRFLCTITRVDGREEARGVVDRLRKQHHEARHHCSAFVIGPDGTLEHSSDDGEPAGTAGAPMLEALRGSGLSDVVAVVTRWFGGVLLGPGGLVRAYGDAVRAGLASTGSLERLLLEDYLILLDHAVAGRAESELRIFGARVVSVEYAERVRLVLAVRPGEFGALSARLSELQGSPVRADFVGTRWIDAS